VDVTEHLSKIQQHQVREGTNQQTQGELLNLAVDKVPKSHVNWVTVDWHTTADG